MFESLWRYIRHLFLPPTPDDITPLLVLTAPETQQFVPSFFYSLVCATPSHDRNRYYVTSLRWYKQPHSTSNSEHEFIVAKLKKTGIDRVFFAVVERGPEEGASTRQVLKTSAPSTSSQETVLADDTIQFFNPDKLQQFLNNKSAKKLGIYKFQRMAFSLLAFARLIHVISQHSGQYKLDDTMCYWYTAAIVEIAKMKFDCSGPDTPPPGAGRLPENTVKVDRIKWRENLKIIGDEYTKVQTADPDPVSPYIAQFQEEAREAREREQQAEERERQAREREQQAREREQQAREDANEVERQARERERQLREEITALRAQLLGSREA